MNRPVSHPCSPIVAVGLFLATASLWMGWFMTDAFIRSPFSVATWWLLAWFPSFLGVGYAGFVSMLPPAASRAARVLFLVLLSGAWALAWVSHEDGPLPPAILVLQVAGLVLVAFDVIRPSPVASCPALHSLRLLGIPVGAWFVACLGFGVFGFGLILALAHRLPAGALPAPIRLVVMGAFVLVPLWVGRGTFFARPTAPIEMVGATMLVAMLLAGVEPLFAYVATACALVLLVGFARYAMGGRAPSAPARE